MRLVNIQPGLDCSFSAYRIHDSCVTTATSGVRSAPRGNLGGCRASPSPPPAPATHSDHKALAESRDYEARHLLVLEGLEAVRKRPAMYIGSTDTRGLMHCLWEIIDNAVDEALGGFGSEI